MYAGGWRHEKDAEGDVTMDVIIRSARHGDEGRLAELSAQLGYPCETAVVSTRLERYLGSDERIVLVAEADDSVLGWLSLEVVDHFYLDRFVEISGFIVDSSRRSTGIGTLMIASAEAWVREHGLSFLRLRTNAIREGAHRFYEREGFERIKEQFVYCKRIE